MTVEVIDGGDIVTVIDEGMMGGPQSLPGTGGGGITPHETLTDATNPYAIYKGSAPIGAVASDPLWSISLITTTGMQVATTKASGVHSWLDRAILTYL